MAQPTQPMLSPCAARVGWYWSCKRRHTKAFLMMWWWWTATWQAKKSSKSVVLCGWSRLVQLMVWFGLTPMARVCLFWWCWVRLDAYTGDGELDWSVVEIENEKHLENHKKETPRHKTMKDERWPTTCESESERKGRKEKSARLPDTWHILQYYRYRYLCMYLVWHIHTFDIWTFTYIGMYR